MATSVAFIVLDAHVDGRKVFADFAEERKTRLLVQVEGARLEAEA
jgi:hypothetical protein